MDARSNETNDLPTSRVVSARVTGNDGNFHAVRRETLVSLLTLWYTLVTAKQTGIEPVYPPAFRKRKRRMRIVPPSWLPECEVIGIVNHWTAGVNYATDLDKEHYHLIINGDGTLVRGDFSIRDNVDVSDGHYAAHCGRHNTKTVGVALAGMAGATEVPFVPGKYAITKAQWSALMQVNADLIEAYDLRITPHTLCAHGMIYSHFGESNPTGKWDPCKLPWAPTLSKEVVDAQIRSLTYDLLGKHEPMASRPVEVVVNGLIVTDDAYMASGRVWVPVRRTCEAMGATVIAGGKNSVLIGGISAPANLTMEIRGSTGFVMAAELREKVLGVGWSMNWDGVARRLTLAKK